jgi:hypothetical protein
MFDGRGIPYAASLDEFLSDRRLLLCGVYPINGGGGYA